MTTYTIASAREFFPRIRVTETIIACDGEPFLIPAGTTVTIAKEQNGRLIVLSELPRGWVWLGKCDLIQAD